MAKTNEIKTKLTIDGEQQFKRAMDDAASAMKELNSEQKLAAAEFKATGDAETYAAERARILKEKIAEQQKVVDAAEDALKQMREKGVQPNNRAYIRMQTNVNDAKASLINMENKLGEVTGGLREGAGEAGNYNEALQTIGNGVTLQGAIDAISGVRHAIINIAKTAAHVMKETWDIMNGAGDWADELLTTAQVYEIPQETLQRWRYAARFIDTDVDTIANAHKKITQQMASTSDDTAEAFNTLNVATKKTDGTFRDSYDVFWETIDALGQIESAEQRNAIAQSLMGKSYDELIPLIKAGRQEFEGYANEAPVVSEEAVKSLGAMDDAFEDLDATLETTKYELLAEFAPTFQTVAEAMTATVKAFQDFMKTKEGQDALNKISEAVTGLITSLTEEGGMEKLVKGAADAVIALKDGLLWIVNNWNTVRRGIEILGAAFGALTVGEGVLRFLQLMNGAKWLGTMFGKGGGREVVKGAAAAAPGAAAGGGGLWAGLGGGIKKALMGGVGFAKSWASMAASMASAMAIPAGVGMLLGAGGGALLDYGYTQSHYGAANQINAQSADIVAQAESAKAAEGLTDVFRELSAVYAQDLDRETLPEIMKIIRENENVLAEALDWEKLLDGYDIESDIISANEQYDAAEFIGRVYAALGEKIVDATEKATVNPKDWAAQQELWQTFDLAMKSGMSPSGLMNLYGSENTQALLAQAFPDMSDYLSNMNFVDESTIAEKIETIKGWLEEDMTAAGLDAATGFTTGISEGTSEATSTATEMAQETVDAVNNTLDSHSPSRVMYDIGQNVAIGLANGITSQIAAAQAAANRLAAIVASTVALRLMIHSPSRVMEQMGAFTAQGFAEGITDNVWRVQDAVGRMSSATMRAPVYSTTGRSAYAGGSGSEGDIHAYIVMDKEIVGEMVAPTVDGWIGSAVREKR